MDVAFLFNSDHPDLGGWYGGAVLNLILRTGVLQASKNHMRIFLGDISTYGASRTMSGLISLCEKVYTPATFDKLQKAKLAATHGRATVYCWLFRNMSSVIATELDQKLLPEASYLGAMAVDFSAPLHWRFFKSALVEPYRLHGTQCSFFYHMSDNEDPDLAVQSMFEENGFTVVYEDAGARGTIFDNYDTIEHATRVGEFQRYFSSLDGVSFDDVSELTMLIEELHPKMFDAFAAAAHALKDARTDEELAQASLSGRRLLEATANHLYPAREGYVNNRKVGKAEYKNRIWAYIEHILTNHDNREKLLNKLGKEADRLTGVFNAGLHATPTRHQLEAGFRDLVIWLAELINVSPENARKPYLAYTDELLIFFNKLWKDKE